MSILVKQMECFFILVRSSSPCFVYVHVRIVQKDDVYTILYSRYEKKPGTPHTLTWT